MSIPRNGVACLLVLALAACGRGSTADAPVLAPVELPEMSRSDPAVRQEAAARFAALMDRAQDPATLPGDLAVAYGELGMFLHAGEFLAAAEPFYRNAQRLAPGDVRWPYYLGHLYKARGDGVRAVAAFDRALVLRPDDVPTLVWLGRLHHDAGRAAEAERMFTRARSIAPEAVAVLAGLGQLALARNDHAAAAAHFEAALHVHPQAAALYAPLAQAYRGLGDPGKAEGVLARWRNTEIALQDPLWTELELSVESAQSFELRGVRALEANDWTAAAEHFRRGIAMAPESTTLGRSLRHKLGTALVMQGEVRAAVDQFEQVLAHAPAGGSDEAAARAHYSLGVLLASAGRGSQAIEHFAAAVHHSPSYAEAHVALADALRRAGRTDSSLGHYREAVALDPRGAVYARFGYGVALTRLGRYAEARRWLEDALDRHPESLELTVALARVLAAAPDGSVRDSARALTLVQRFAGDQTLEVRETVAMVQAGAGEFAAAAAGQRRIVDAAARAGWRDQLGGLTENLHRYERRERPLLPWRTDDPVHAPGPPVDPAIRAALSGG